MESSLNFVELLYLRQLGTPFPVGEIIGCEYGHDVRVSGYVFKPECGLQILTDIGTTLNDYETACPERKAAIRRFFDKANTGKQVPSCIAS